MLIFLITHLSQRAWTPLKQDKIVLTLKYTYSTERTSGNSIKNMWEITRRLKISKVRYLNLEKKKHFELNAISLMMKFNKVFLRGLKIAYYYDIIYYCSELVVITDEKYINSNYSECFLSS